MRSGSREGSMYVYLLGRSMDDDMVHVTSSNERHNEDLRT